MSGTTRTEDSRARSASWVRSPVILLLAAAAILPAILTLPLTVPIGSMYWDLTIYFDAANRISGGQVPSVDFFAPVGPLGYYLFAIGHDLFQAAQPLLLASWSMFVVSAPLMALVMRETERSRSRNMALGLLIPFLVFSVLPFNLREYFPYPGSDGFGIYNRQICQLLYVLVAALVFVRPQRLLAFVVTLAMAALFFTKITGFVAGFMLCILAFAAGRLSFRHACGAAIAFFAILGALELWHGLTVQYALDILALLHKNSGTLLARFMHAGSRTFGIVAPAGLLALMLLWSSRGKIGRDWKALIAAPSAPAIHSIFDHEALWLFVVLFAGVFLETQNTGSQSLIFLWPVLIAIVGRSRAPVKYLTPRYVVIVLLACASVLPPFVHVVHRAARTYASALINEPLPQENLKTLGAVNARPELVAHAAQMMEIYSKHRDTYRDFVDNDALPAFMYYLQYDFQLVQLMTVDRAIADIRALEQEKDIRFQTMLELNFVNPFPYLMDRQAPKYVAIGADPTRAVPTLGSREEQAVRATDLVLYPTCPFTTDNRDLFELYRPALADHLKIRLDRCFDAYVNPRFAAAFR